MENGGSIQFYNCIGYSYCAILLNESLEGSDLIVLTGPLRMRISSHWLPISSNPVSVTPKVLNLITTDLWRWAGSRGKGVEVGFGFMQNHVSLL